MGIRFLIAAAVASVFFGATASADIVFNQVPNQSGGYVSDTDQTFFGQEHYWQRVADDFQLGEAADLTQVVFFGFFYNSYYAPEDEVVRLRFYHARETDDLPNESAIVFEQTVQNPSRQETGEHVFAGPDPPEYRYTIDLASPVSVAANTKYWLEFVQLGDPDSDFIWESAHALPQDRIAGVNAGHPDWIYSTTRTSLAFQLLTPEPSTVGFVTFSLLLYLRRRVRRGACARSG